jgi:CysZ protein
VWGGAALVLWTRTAYWFAEHLRQWAASGAFLIRFEAGDWMLVVAHVIMFLLFVPLVYLTALLILSVFAMQKMVDHVAARRFPQLARRQGGSVAGSVLAGVGALIGAVLLGIVTLPLWLIPPLWPAIPVAILGWVNQKVLRYDAVAEHATAEEMRALFAANRGSLFVLGALLAVLAYVPPLGFLAPVLSGLAFIHFLLGDLERRRGEPIEGEARVIEQGESRVTDA